MTSCSTVAIDVVHLHNEFARMSYLKVVDTHVESLKFDCLTEICEVFAWDPRKENRLRKVI